MRVNSRGGIHADTAGVDGHDTAGNEMANERYTAPLARSAAMAAGS